MKKYCRLCKKKEHREECGFGPKMWDKYSVDDATNKEQEIAAKESGITDGMGESFENSVLEANKSGDNSLRDWFSKSKSSDGKLVGCNLVVNMQENPVQSNQDKQPNPSVVLAR